MYILYHAVEWRKLNMCTWKCARDLGLQNGHILKSEILGLQLLNIEAVTYH